MANIINYHSKTIAAMMASIDIVKYNPSAIQRATFDILKEVTQGTLDIVDPTNPFVFLLESSSVNTAVATNENVVNLRKQYPSLSQTESDLYNHMFDIDYSNRFAEPSQTTFTISLQVPDINTKMVLDPTDGSYRLTLPRNTEFKIDGVTFSISYPIDIRRFTNGVVQISYDASEHSPVDELRTNIIDYRIVTDKESVDWLFFDVQVKQYAILTEYYVIQNSKIFNTDLQFEDNYYFARVWFKNASTAGEWKEIKVTHSEQVHDINVVTAVLKVTGTTVNVSIPPIYVSSGMISGNIRVDVYTTKGKLNLDLANYRLPSFSDVLKGIDKDKDLNAYTVAMGNTSHYSFSAELVDGGRNSLTFPELRDRVINNSVGDRVLPITNIQLEYYVKDSGFDIVKNVDILTNRIFLATRRLPKPSNRKLVSAANIGISTYVTNINILSALSSAKNNGVRQTILPDHIYQSVNGLIRSLDDAEQTMLESIPRDQLVSVMNGNSYLYTPFYYVLDNTSEEFEVRAYELDHPTTSYLNFVSQNPTLQLVVNTGSYSIGKIDGGFRLTTTTKSGNFYKQVADSQMSAQLSFIPVGEREPAYINGVLSGLSPVGERIYHFDLLTSYDIDIHDNLIVNNAKMFDGRLVTTRIPLTSVFNVIYGTDSITTEFTPTIVDSILNVHDLTAETKGITLEEIEVTLGMSLKSLWKRSRTIVNGLDYEVHANDVPMHYTTPVYDTDPVTGSIFTVDGTGALVYNILHNVGDPVLDSLGVPIMKYHVGDVVLDAGGDPVITSPLSANKEIDMLFIDAKYLFITNPDEAKYREELVKTLTTWIVSDLSGLNDKLLEQTKLLFYPRTNTESVKVYQDNGDYILLPSQQVFTLDLIVKSSVFDDTVLRDNLTALTVRTVSEYISGNNKVNMTDLTVMLRDLYGESVKSVDIHGLGGAINYKLLHVANEHNGLTVAKKLVLQQDNSIIIEEDVTVNFHRLDQRAA